ncbi:MAG: CPBP family intramembrane metalloprotease [Anaerolineae bacterium]|nr:MAG: CPBP family intramembrane metalloprotease [Anaerolineae bacterium]
MKKHPMFWFYVLAFAISWLGWLPMVAASRGISWFQHPAFQILLLLPAIGPTLAAVTIQRVLSDKTKTGVWFRSLWHWKAGVLWFVVAIVLPLTLHLADNLTAQTFGLSPSSEMAGEKTAGLFLPAFVMALLSNPWEEVGWRGFALPRLQARYPAFTATLIVGALWALWHLPLFFWADNPMSEYPFVLWFISTVAVSFVYTWLYNSTQGSVLFVALYHVMDNTFGVLISSGSVAARGVVNLVVAAILCAVFGMGELSRLERVRAD